MKLKRSITIIVIGLLPLLGGCATIVGDNTQLIPISSTPNSAQVTITDEAGSAIFTGETPTSVALAKSNGSYWGGKDYVVKISKAGYAEQNIPIVSSPNGWYIAGNFFFGGLIGWFILDPLSGKMYTLSPELVSAALDDETAHSNMEEGSISIVLLQDVPPSLLTKMERLY